MLCLEDKTSYVAIKIWDLDRLGLNFIEKFCRSVSEQKSMTMDLGRVVQAEWVKAHRYIHNDIVKNK